MGLETQMRLESLEFIIIIFFIVLSTACFPLFYPLCVGIVKADVGKMKKSLHEHI